MMKHPKCAHFFEVVSDLPIPLASLRELAFNFRWTWDHPTRELFREIDRGLFEATGHNPVQMLAELTPQKLQRLSEDEVFLAKLNRCHKDLMRYLEEPRWFQGAHPEVQGPFAYFCAEFGVSESLPIYSGGLGVLAGDHLKAASDLGVPLVGVGLLYSRGYFRQFLSADGWQQEHYPNYDFYSMALHLVRQDSGQPLTVRVEFPDRTVTCQIWRADVGRVPLYLLDSNVLENQPTDQGITDTLYGGDEEMRIRQEMILGIGGMRALAALGIEPTVCHMNEGHAAFLALERIRTHMEAKNVDFRLARQACVNGNVFTTHTPVPAGFDVFKPEMVTHYLETYSSKLGISMAELLKMGRFNAADQTEAFNMAVLAMENANSVNGVSKLHAAVSRGMFHSRWASMPEDEVPVQAVTNGVHSGTWTCARMTELFDNYLGEDWRKDPANPEVWAKIRSVPDAELWGIRENQRGDFVRFVRKYLQQSAVSRVGRGAALEQILDPRILTVGFARRFATYKRATMLLTDRERLKRILFHPDRPVQFVFAGKSHPRDDAGKKFIQDIVHFIEHEGARARMVFLEDYDMQVARMLVQGVDVWLNNPRRPLEASGTSGMKVIPNGGLNCSILDGWWDEGYRHGLGWAIGDRTEVSDHGQQDWLDAQALYHLLEHEIAPVFYHRVEGGVPNEWVDMIKSSIAQLTPYFSTARMVRDYVEDSYVPAHAAFSQLRDDPKLAGEAILWRDRIQTAWPKVRILEVNSNARAANPLGHPLEISVTADLDGISPEEIVAQVVIGKVGSNRELVDSRVALLDHTGGEGSIHRFSAKLECTIPGNRGFAVRLLPHHPVVNVAHELPLVRWEG